MDTKFDNAVLEIASEYEGTQYARRLREKFKTDIDCELKLKLNEYGLSLVFEEQVLTGDFSKMLNRVKKNNLGTELLVKAAKIKNTSEELTALDATAGLGDDSLLLAAAGFKVKMYERNPVMFELLCDTLRRAKNIPELTDVVSRMEVINADSIETMNETEQTPDVILLDPMFPERQKSSLVKKKLQMIQKLEIPCIDETEMLYAAIKCQPKKIIVKRPPKGPYLAGVKPDYSLKGKAVRFDCIIPAPGRKFKKEGEK